MSYDVCYSITRENVCLRFPDRRKDFMNQELELVMNTLISEMGKMEARINSRMDKRFEQIDKRLEQHDKRMDRIEEDMKMYVNTLVEEMGKMEARMDKRFQKVDERFDKMDVRLDSMQHEINACKLASETISILIQKVDQHEYRIERLEKKMA